MEFNLIEKMILTLTALIGVIGFIVAVWSITGTRKKYDNHIQEIKVKNNG